AGLVLMFGSGRLGTLLRLLPARIRERLQASMINHTPAFQSQLFIWGRLVAEAVALWLVLDAFGIEVNAYQVMAAFGVSQLAGGVPGTPGGMGITEGALAFILAAYGFPVTITLAPVLVFRIISYWLPATLGFMAGGSTFLGSEAARAADVVD
ncbi:MAG TPA: flippase-like domain-containing protein, partial [Acidimicrobiia bacterium]|nr:flippase-like domain-containing protein [Acidimicrobiia bacterium]